MTTVGQPERATQDRVVALFRDELGYRYLGDWTDRSGNSNIEEGLLSTWLTGRGHSAAQIGVALHKLRTEAANQNRTLYGNNQAVYSGTVHVEQVLEYNQDPTYLRDLLLYRLTLEAQKRIAESPLSKRDIVRRLGTSAAQLYRLLDQTNYRKSVDQLLALLQVLNCDVDLIVRTKTA